MAYTPKTWVCGETITADGLNNIEEGIQDALECCDHGYECDIETTTVFDGSITTVDEMGFGAASFTPSASIEGDSVAVTLNGTKYELPKSDISEQIFYYGDFNGGMPSFTNYPCLIVIQGANYTFATETPGTYTVKIEDEIGEIITTDCFEKAVNKVVRHPLTRLVDGSADGSVRHINAQAFQGDYSFAEGYLTEASGDYSHAEGYATHAYGNNSHAEGQSTEASGSESHAEGSFTKATGQHAHAEGSTTTASGSISHAEGYHTKASGSESHAEGSNSEASGFNSHVEGYYTIANHRSQHVFGEYNVADPSSASSNDKGNYIEIVGNGTSGTRSNARTLDWNGNEVLKGNLTLGKGTADETTITAAQLKALLALLQ